MGIDAIKERLGDTFLFSHFGHSQGLLALIDWITAELPCHHEPVNGGMVCKTDRNGEIVWETSCFLSAVGSYEASIRYKSTGGDGQGKATAILIDGNPAKFLQGHNILGSDDLLALVFDLYQRICQAEGLEPPQTDIEAVRRGRYSLRRIDITHSFSLNTRADVLAWLRAAEYRSKTRHGRPSMKGSTLYWGKSSKRWTLKAYSKGQELTAGKGHKLPAELQETPLPEWADNKLRIELTLRGKQLDELSLNEASKLDSETIFALYDSYLKRLTMTEQMQLTDDLLVKLPHCLRTTYVLWRDGHDMRDNLSRNTYYRHRKALMAYGINIDIRQEKPGRSNVVPLVRILEAKPAGIPDWAFTRNLVHHSARPLKSVSSL